MARVRYPASLSSRIYASLGLIPGLRTAAVSPTGETSSSITVRIRPRYITTDLSKQVIGAAGSNVITPFDDNARAVATAMVYEGGALVIAMYRPGTAPDAELNREVAVSHADTGLNVWPAELVREYGAFTAYSGRVDRISSYT